MPLWTCEQCGAQFPEIAEPPPACLVCEDERQYVNWKGQTWLTREALTKITHSSGATTSASPASASSRALRSDNARLLVREADGCVMWDCLPLITREGIDYVRSLGGLKAIAVSHPHYYGAVADWSDAFGGVPVYLHGDDRGFVTRPHAAIVPWTGDSHRISDDILLVRTGGHFAGGTVMHWRAGAQGSGALLTGDVAMVAMDRRSLSFMYSFPNYIPLNAAAVRRIWDAVAPLAFDRIYGAWWGRNIGSNARAAFEISVRRYIAAISG